MFTSLPANLLPDAAKVPARADRFLYILRFQEPVIDAEFGAGLRHALERVYFAGPAPHQAPCCLPAPGTPPTFPAARPPEGGLEFMIYSYPLALRPADRVARPSHR